MSKLGMMFWEVINFMEVEVEVEEQKIRKWHLSSVLKYE